jgi:hypothetical protein
MFERSFATVFNAVESASSPVSGIEKLAMIHLLLIFHAVVRAVVAGRWACVIAEELRRL